MSTPHGTRYAYNSGCHCGPCTEANARYKSEWSARRRAAKTHRVLHGYWLPVTPESGIDIGGRGDARTPPGRGPNTGGSST